MLNYNYNYDQSLPSPPDSCYADSDMENSTENAQIMTKPKLWQNSINHGFDQIS